MSSDGSKERRIQRRREERERQERMRGWHNVASERATGAHPPTEDEQSNSPFYAEKVERLMQLLQLGDNLDTLASLMMDVAAEHGLKTWSTKAAAKRSLGQLLEGHSTMAWVMDIMDATVEEFQA